MSLTKDQLTASIKALPAWPRVEIGNYPSWDGGYRQTELVAAVERLRLAVEWMRGRMPCATGECCHELRDMIAACEVPESE